MIEVRMTNGAIFFVEKLSTRDIYEGLLVNAKVHPQNKRLWKINAAHIVSYRKEDE